MGGLIIEGCATFVEYIGALVFLGEIINRTNVKRIIFMVLPMVLLTVGNNLTDIVSLNAILLYFSAFGSLNLLSDFEHFLSSHRFRLFLYLYSQFFY